MKKTLFSIVLVLSYCSIFAQYDHYTTIKTPTNVSIEAIYRVEYSTNDLAKVEAQAAAWINRYGSQAIRVAPASRTYNCHNFAWHSSDGGSRVWINQNNQSGGANLSKYWSGTSPTYVQTTSLKATKIFYANGDHSAKVVSTGVFESKWGEWPRYRHSPTDCPYVSSGLQYYYIPLSGDALICSSKTYTALNISGATYSWSGTNLVFSGSGSSITATKISDGSGWIQTKISSPYSGTTVASESKIIWVGTPSTPNSILGFTNGQYFGSRSITDFYLDYSANQGINQFNWQITGGSILFGHGQGPYIDMLADRVFGSQKKNLEVNVKVGNDCGWSYVLCVSGYVISGIVPAQLALYPNPASNNVSITIPSDQDAASGLTSADAQPVAAISQNSTTAYTVNIYSQFGALLYTAKRTGNTFTVPVNNLRDGTYIIEVNDGKQKYSQQLAVKH